MKLVSAKSRKNPKVNLLEKYNLILNMFKRFVMKDKCGDVMCMIYCEHGFLLDENGCEQCECKPAPEMGIQINKLIVVILLEFLNNLEKRTMYSTTTL